MAWPSVANRRHLAARLRRAAGLPAAVRRELDRLLEAELP
jgi:hypothetical protein